MKDTEELKKDKRNKIIGLSLGIVIVLVAVFAGTYAYWQLTKKQADTNDLVAACLDFDFVSEDDGISLENAWPMTNEEGSNLTGYTFKVVNNCDIDLEYQIGLEALETTSANYLDFNSIKVIIDNEKPRIYNNLLTIDNVGSEGENIRITKELSTNIVPASSYKTHNLKLYLDADAPISEQGKGFKGKVLITGGQNITQKDKTILLASVDVSETQSCTDAYRRECTDLNPNPNHVVARMYNDGTISFGGTGAIKGNKDEVDMFEEIYYKILKEYLTSDRFTPEEQEIFTEETVWGIGMLFSMNYSEFAEYNGVSGAANNRDDFLELMEVPEESLQVMKSILIKLEEDGFIGNDIKLVFEDGITTIGAFFMAYDVFVDSIEMADTVKVIDKCAFNEMPVSGSVHLSSNLEVVGGDALSFDAPNLDLVIPDSVYEFEWLDDINVHSLKLPNNPNVDEFSSYGHIGSLYVPQNIKHLTLDSIHTANIYAYGPERADLRFGGTPIPIHWNYTD